MKNIKKLLALVLAVCLMGTLALAASAEKLDVDTENNIGVLDMTHLDVKADATYAAQIDGETVLLDATLDPSSIVVSVSTPDANINYAFADYKVYTLTEAGRTEYRIVLDGTDGALLNLIHWDGVSFGMKNVYVSARFVFEEVPEALVDEMEQDSNGNYYVDWSGAYTGIQECTSHNGLRSEGNHGVISGVDLYLSGVPGISVETPEEPSVPETTEPSVPETTEPSVPETTEPSVPETTEPSVPETTEPSAPETTEPADPTVPETTVPTPPTDDVPDTGDTSITMLIVLLSVSIVGMVATLVIGNKAKYIGKWEH